MVWGKLFKHFKQPFQLLKYVNIISPSYKGEQRVGKERLDLRAIECPKKQKRTRSLKTETKRACRPLRVPASLPALSLQPGAVFREERESTQIPQKERFFGRAWASHPRQPLQASSHPLFICEGRLTHPARLHTTKPGPRTHEGGRHAVVQTHQRAIAERISVNT